MSVLLVLAPAFMTFICAPSQSQKAKWTYVVSFERDDDRIKNIVVLWPNGSQSHDRWKARILPAGFEFDASDRSKHVYQKLTLAWESIRPDAGGLTYRWAVSSGHVPLDSEESAACTVRSEDVTGPVK
jgi:hypothetical protein